MTQTPKLIVIDPTKQESGNLRVAAYCRVSSDSEDQLHSYVSQIQYYTDLINGRPEYTLVDIYADEGLTGTKTDKRDDFLRLVNDCRKGKIDRVLTKSVSRFARNTLDTIRYVRELKKYGVSILFEADQIDTAYLSSEMLLLINGARAQEESLSISRNQRMNCRARMKNGTYISSATPYGYALTEGGELEIIPEQAEIVRLIFDSYLSGLGKIKIAELLTERNAPLRKGQRKWYPTAINYILRNERYVGDALFQKSYTSETLPFRKLKNHGDLPQYYVDNANPPIISREKFDAVQSRIKEGYRYKRGTVYPLTGKIHCHCGCVYTLVIVNEIRYWECHAHNQNSRNCDSRRIPESDIENAFVDMVNKLRLTQKDVVGAAIAQMERLQKRRSGAQGQIRDIDQQIADLNGQTLVLNRLHNKNILSTADYAAQCSTITSKVNLLRQERRRLMEQDDGTEYLDALTGLGNILSLTDCQTAFDADLFQQLVVQITAPTHTSLCFELLGGLQLTMPIPPQRRCSRK